MLTVVFCCVGGAAALALVTLSGVLMVRGSVGGALVGCSVGADSVMSTVVVLREPAVICA